MTRLLRLVGTALLVALAPAAAWAGGPKSGAAAPPRPKPPPAAVASRTAAAQAASARPAPARAEPARMAAARPKAPPVIRLHHTTTGESFALAPDPRGRIEARRLRGLRRFLRCHHTGREHAIAPRLASVLYQTARHFGDRVVEIVAGYRAPRVAKEKGNSKSPHKRGVACDFKIHGVPNDSVRDFLRKSFGDVGVGYYPNSGFVHVDVGRRQRAFWIDYSGPGERARYVPDPGVDPRTGRPAPSAGEGADPEASGAAAVTDAPEATDDDALADDPGLADLRARPER